MKRPTAKRSSQIEETSQTASQFWLKYGNNESMIDMMYGDLHLRRQYAQRRGGVHSPNKLADFSDRTTFCVISAQACSPIKQEILLVRLRPPAGELL
jgi:hypothetical protein